MSEGDVATEFTALEQVRVWIATVTGLPAFWRDQPEVYTPGGYVVINMVDVDTIGQDGVRYERDPDAPAGSEMVPTVIGQREFTMRLEARSWTQELALTAEAYLETIRLSLRLPSTQLLFDVLNIGLVRARIVAQSNAVVDERVQSRAVLDIRFTTSIQLTMPTEGTGYIDTVDVETTYQGGVDGPIVVPSHQGNV